MILYSVIIRLLSLVLIFVPAVRKRVMFERRNANDKFAKRFSNADVAFEFSSEGEFQQVLPLITDALIAGKKIELIYFSPSVEKGVYELCQKHPEQLRALRFPLLTGGLLPWISAKKLVLVRYDLFPELLAFPGELNIVWMTFKKERSRNKSISWWKKKFMAKATKIIYATDADAKTGSELGFPGEVFDFRIEQIKRRMDFRSEKFSRIFPEYQVPTVPREKRLILGNVWPSDIEVFKDIPEDFQILVVPHKLDKDIIDAFERFFGNRAMVLNKKGVLCELYADFGFAYVGGGFETSIHSVLEPLISGADRIACGPMTFRSTEFDLAVAAGKMTVVENSQEFRKWLGESLVSGGSFDKLIGDYPIHRKAIISC